MYVNALEGVGGTEHPNQPRWNALGRNRTRRFCQHFRMHCMFTGSPKLILMWLFRFLYNVPLRAHSMLSETALAVLGPWHDVWLFFAETKRACEFPELSNFKTSE